MSHSNPDEEAKVRDLVEAWAKAIENKDIEGTVAHHSADVVYFDVPVQAVTGIEAYRKSFEEFFPWISQAGFKLSDLKVTAGDDVAFCQAFIHCGLTRVDETGKTLEQVPRLTIGLHKVNGRWEITHEHHSVPDVGL